MMSSQGRNVLAANEVYEQFIKEVETLTIKADTPAIQVVGQLTRAVRRAANTVIVKYDGEDALDNLPRGDNNGTN